MQNPNDNPNDFKICRRDLLILRAAFLLPARSVAEAQTSVARAFALPAEPPISPPTSKLSRSRCAPLRSLLGAFRQPSPSYWPRAALSYFALLHLSPSKKTSTRRRALACQSGWALS